MSEPHDASRRGWRKRWPLIKKILTYVFFILVAGLLIGLARNVDWDEVYQTLRNYDARTLWLAGPPHWAAMRSIAVSMCLAKAMRSTTCPYGKSCR